MLRDAAKRRLSRSGRLYATAALLDQAVRVLLRRPHDDDFRIFRRLDRPCTVVDVGANRGQSALSLAVTAPRSTRIVSFEANPENEPYLLAVRRLLGRRFHYVICGLGEAPSMRTFYVPVQGTRRITGEASFDLRSLEAGVAQRVEGAFSLEEFDIAVRRLDDFPLVPDIVKVDVQGLELEVVRGMTDLLERHQPLLMIENNGALDSRLAAFLATWGYVRLVRSADRNLLRDALDQPRGTNSFFAAAATIARWPALFEEATSCSVRTTQGGAGSGWAAATPDAGSPRRAGVRSRVGRTTDDQ